jgi:cephalosporin-C deacetylase
MPTTFSFNPKTHGFPFDPTYGFTLEALQSVRAGEAPSDFEAFWRGQYEKARLIQTEPSWVPCRYSFDEHSVYEFDLKSTADAQIGGWLLLPKQSTPKRALVVTHGYGGRETPHAFPGWGDFAILLLCLRGFNRSAQTGVPADAYAHVVHGILNRDDYVLGRCVEDLWCAVSALEETLPSVIGRIGYSGVSFGGGIGALAAPWDTRIQRVHLEVPTFGHQQLRLTLPTLGSGQAVSLVHRRHPVEVCHTLSYFDAAFAARYLHQPSFFACARFDPAVAPPGQWAIFNEAAGLKQVYVLEAGHYDFPRQNLQAVEHETKRLAFFELL